MLIEHLPPQFVWYRLEQLKPGEKPTKIPCGGDGRNIDHLNPANWMDYATVSNPPMPGLRVGFVLTKDDPWFCVDMDGCRDAQSGQWTSQAHTIWQNFTGAACEISISGTGMHIMGKCDPTITQMVKNKWDGWLELYTHGRFIAFGDDGWCPIGTFEPDRDWTNNLRAWVPHRPILEALTGEVDARYTGPEDDEELKQMMLNSTRGAVAAFGGKATIRQLWEADPALGKFYPAYDKSKPFDHSSADAALMLHLAFWTGKDTARMDRLFRQSKLMRPKYERNDYRMNTVTRAAQMCNRVYDQTRQSQVIFDPSTSLHAAVTDDRLALILGDRGWNENARFIPEIGIWVLWGDTGWREAYRFEHITRLRDDLRGISREVAQVPKERRRFENKSAVMDVAETIKSNPGMIRPIAQWNFDHFLLGTPTGVVELTTGEFRQPHKEDYITKRTLIDPANAEESPALFLSFLTTITGNNPQLTEYIQMVFGYALTGSTKEHAMFFFYGSGRNGKSTLLNVMTDVLGDYAATASSNVFLEQRNEGHSTDLASLEGARLVRCSEIPVGKSWNEALIKRVTGGDPITARLMRQDPRSFTPQMTPIIDANNKPTMKGVDEALRRRFNIVPFNVTIQANDVDKDLPEKLKSEYPAILSWAIEGCLKWQKSGLVQPAVVQQVTKDYLDDEDVFGSFLDENYDKGTCDRVERKILGRHFGRYLSDRNLHPWRLQRIYNEAEKHGLEARKSSGIWYLVGLSPKTTTGMPIG